MKKRMIFLIEASLFLAILMTLFGCDRKEPHSESNGPAVRKTERYAMVVFLKGSEFWNWSYAGMIDAAKLLGPHVKVELQGPAEWDATLEARVVEQLIARRMDALIVTAADPKVFVIPINKAIDAGIPVITFGNDAPESKRLCYVGTDDYNAGWVAGKEVSHWLNGEGEVGISTYTGLGFLDKRVKGFVDALARFGPDIKVVATVNDEGDVAKAESLITSMMLANPEIDCIFCSHGNPGPGAAAALRNLDLQDKVDIMAFDFGTPVIELIEKGQIRATVAQGAYLMGYQAMMMAYSAKHKTNIPAVNPDFGHIPAVIDTGVSILYQGDVGKYKKTPRF
ncbi:MAG: substrate-binding domain-containing protein [Planctomycetota bacterium]|jgi:ribose transport system substrate-binding protein